MEMGQDLTDLTLGDLRRDLKSCLSSARGIVLSGLVGVAHTDLMLSYILLHDIVIELVRLLVGQVVVDLSTMRLDNVSFIGTGAVG